jgi:hypothetical protein
MADDVEVNPTASYTVAADDVAGVLHQRVKVGFGEEGAYGDVNPTNALPVAGTVTVANGVSVSAQVSGTVTVNGTVTQANGASVTIQQGASVSAVVSGTVTVNGTVTVANGASVTIQQGASVSVSVVNTIVTVLGTQVVTVVPGLSVSAVVSGTVTVAGTVTVSNGASVSVNVVNTIATILGTQVVTVVPGLSVSAVVSGTVTALGTTVVSGTLSVDNIDQIYTTGLPTQVSTGQIVIPKEVPVPYVQIVVVSTAIAQSAGKYAFTIWTGATGAPAAAGTTSWAVPAGKFLRLNALQAAITSSAVLGGSVQVFVGVGATASMISASIPTQLQVLKLQLFGAATLDRAQLLGHQADIPAGESIAVFIVASTAAILRDLVIAGNLF